MGQFSPFATIMNLIV